LPVFGQPSFLQDYGDLDNAKSRVERLESDHGQNSFILAEPLAELAQLYTEHGRYDEAYRALDRATLIIRRDKGLYTREQIPFLQKKIENFAASLDWENAREQMEHIYWLYLQKSAIGSPNLISDLLHLSDMHLRGVNEDFIIHQSYHFRRAMTLNWAALAVAEKVYGSSDKKLVPIIYNLLKQYHLQQVAVKNGGSLGYQLREIYPGSNLVRSRSETRKYFYYMGRRLLNQLAAIYSHAGTSNAESLAMVSVYTADWQVLFNQHAEALESYKNSYKELEKISAIQAETMFRTPRVIPLSDFYTSMSEVVSTDTITGSIEPRKNFGGPYRMVFRESGAGFPSLGQPAEFSMSDDILSNRALLEFNLPQVNGEFAEETDSKEPLFGKPFGVEILDLDKRNLAQVEKFKTRVQDLSFRPKIVGGLPRKSEILLEYKIFSRLKE
tara:strand:- start:2040 stop:3362 length:1323 start_codon:yes stop_codon:yes gene_type:complete